MKHLVYKITRDDDQVYIGITIDYRLKNRMSVHKGSERFKNHDFEYEILFESEDRSTIYEKEEYYINLYDSFKNGLNKTKGGKGYGHNSKNFTTFGYKFNEKSKKKMSISAKERAKREGIKRSELMKRVHGTPEARKKNSESHKGIISHYKLSEEEIAEIRNIFSNYKNELIGTKAKNGRVLTKERLLAKEIHKNYNVSPAAIINVLKGKTLR